MAARLGVGKNELDFLKAADIVGEHELRLLKEQPNAPRVTLCRAVATKKF